MNIIALTGANARAMADVAELVLARITAANLAVAVMVYVEDVHQVIAMREGATGLVSLWRIGADPRRPDLDSYIDAFIDDSDGVISLDHAADMQVDRYIVSLMQFNQGRAC